MTPQKREPLSVNQVRENESLPDRSQLCHRHLVFGWWSLLVFLALGIFLETLHGFKLTWYLGVDAETRRLMWTLAHSHGTLFSLVHIAFALTVTKLPDAVHRSQAWASLCLIGAGLLMPLGFFLGGVFYYAGDPGLGVLLVPAGAGLLLAGVGLVATAVTQNARQ